jgi:DNA-binding transcriptional LysR family regulator
VSNSGETLHRAALAGVGVFLGAGFLVHDDLETGQLVRLLPEFRTVEFSMNAVYPHRHHLSAKVRTFIDLLVHHAAEQQKLINPYS